jgi:type VI secretion system secreted protein Hcp
MSQNMSIVFEGMDLPSSDPIPVASWKHDFSQAKTAVGPNAELVEFAKHGDFQFTKDVGIASIQILRHCWTGRKINAATFSVYRADKSRENIKHLEVRMENVLVSNVTVGGGPSSVSEDTVTLCYEKITYKFISPDTGYGGVEKAFSISHDLKREMISS